MKVIIGCEFSGIVREAFKARGHDVWSCDFLPTEIPGQHIQGNVLDYLDDGWDLGIFHPPCTYLANCQVHLLDEKVETNRGWVLRRILREEALLFAKRFLDCKIPKTVVENPIGYINSQVRKHDQIIHPYEHGHGVQKQYALWLKNLPLLVPSNPVPGRKLHWWHQSPGPERWKIKSRTFPGVAKAMAEQWG